MDREKILIDVLNRMIQVLEPIRFEDFNCDFPTSAKGDLLELEKENDKLGVKVQGGFVGCTNATIIATITDILVDKRLAFKIDEDGFIIGFQFV